MRVSKKLIAKVIFYVCFYTLLAYVVYISDLSELINYFAIWWELAFDVIPDPLLRSRVMPIVTGIVAIIGSVILNECSIKVIKLIERTVNKVE